MRLLCFALESVMELSTVRLLMPKDLRQLEGRMGVAQRMKEAFRRYA